MPAALGRAEIDVYLKRYVSAVKNLLEVCRIVCLLL